MSNLSTKAEAVQEEVQHAAPLRGVAVLLAPAVGNVLRLGEDLRARALADPRAGPEAREEWSRTQAHQATRSVGAQVR